MLAVGEQLLTRGSFALPSDFLMTANIGRDGRRYSRYGPGQSVLAIPFIFLGNIVALAAPPYAHGFIVRLFVLMLPALATAATALMLYVWARAIGYRRTIALLVGLLYGFSMAWPYSRMFFAEPLTTLFLVVCACGMRQEHWGWWVAAGAAAAFAVATKVQSLLFLPFMAGYMLLVCWRGSLRSFVVSLASRTLFGSVGLVVPLTLLLLYHTIIFGGPLKTGYGGMDPTGLLVADWKEGLYGLTLSTGEGLLVFSPTVLLGMVGMGLRVRKQWREALLAGCVTMVALAFYSRFIAWYGDGSWGPRYLVPVLPFLMLTAAAPLSIIVRDRMQPKSTHMHLLGRIGVGAVGGLALCTFLIQLLPVLANANTYLQMSDTHQRIVNPLASPLVGHWRLWWERVGEWWLRVAPPPGVAVLRDGFSYSEGDRAKGELFPRWTHAQAQIQIYPPRSPANSPVSAPLSGTLVVGDHRPWPLARANFSLLLDGEPLPNVKRTDRTGQGIFWELQFALSPQQVRPGMMLVLQSDTWNPELTTDDNPRNEELGVRLEAMRLTYGEHDLAIREALPIPTVKNNRRDLWLWYYDTPYHHLFDAWLWYLVVANLPPHTMVVLLLLIALPASILVVGGGWGCVATLWQPESTACRAP